MKTVVQLDALAYIASRRRDFNLMIKYSTVQEKTVILNDESGYLYATAERNDNDTWTLKGVDGRTRLDQVSLAECMEQALKRYW